MPTMRWRAKDCDDSVRTRYLAQSVQQQRVNHDRVLGLNL
jgi:hypothetical protein